MTSADSAAEWQRRFESEVLGRRVGRHRDDRFLFRPGQLLVHADDHDRATERLRRYDPRPHEHSAVLAAQGLPIRAIQLADEHAFLVPDIVDELRALAEPLRAAPNHVFVGSPGYSPGGAGVPEQAPPVDELPAPPAGDPAVEILDTGLPAQLATWHPPLAAATGPIDAGCLDLLDEDADGRLDLEAGHGTFVAGVLRRCAPGVRFAAHTVLTPGGVGDEVQIAAALARTSAPVLNLSLAGYTVDDEPPLALAAAIRALAADRVVVAAAGNAGDDRKTWPAALPEVVAVAALTADGSAIAGFSSYGDWVDAGAPGVDLHSTYVVGDYGPSAEEVVRFEGWARWSGTSFAAPQIAGAVAVRMHERGCTARAAWESLVAERGRRRLVGAGAVFGAAADLPPQPLPA